MRRRTRTAALAAAAALWAAPAAIAAEAEGPLPHHEWSFQGIFGTFDRAALQRGFQVYNQICSACHSMRFLSYRHLAQIGFSEDQIKAIAASVSVPGEPNDQGEIEERPGRPTDRFKSPFPNEQAARAANNGALPPDLSLIVSARPGGADYVRALLTGFEAEPPPDVRMREGMFYNKYFAGNQIAMPPPLSDGAVEYADGTKATVPQMAADVSTFLSWAAEPELETRKRLGVKVVLFLIVLTGMLYAVKRRVWSDVEH